MLEITTKQKIKKTDSQSEHSAYFTSRASRRWLSSLIPVNRQRVDTSEFGGTSKRLHKDEDVDKNIENLKQIYDFDLEQKEEIENFLRKNKEIIQVLQDAKNFIKQYFKGESLYENLYIEYENGEEYEDGGELVLSIETKKSVKQSLESLGNFEKDWWTDKWIQINSKLSIDVRFIK